MSTSPETPTRPWIRADRDWPLPLRVERAHLQRLAAWCARWYPLEACGLLVGRRGLEADHVAAVVPARNVEDERGWDRFVIAPDDWLRCEARARERGLDVLGAWHSRPAACALPSEAHLAAAWEGYVYLVRSCPRGGPGEHRAWRLDGGVFVEQRLEVRP